MARQSPSCDTASYCFALPLLHASYKRSDHASDQDSSRDAWSRSSRPPVSDASPPLNLDTLPPHPNSCRWSTPSGRPPMAILEPPPPSDAVSHSAELFLRLAQLENEKSRTPTPELQDEAEFSSLQQRLAERAESPRIEYVPHTDPSAHPGFSSLPFWVPPRESPASIFYNPKAAQRARSQETTRDQGMAPTDCGNAEDRVARSSAENVIPSAVRVKREPEEQGLQPLLSPMSTDDVAMFKSEPMDEAPPPPPPTKRRRGEADADDEPRRPPLPLSPDSGGSPSRRSKRRRVSSSVTDPALAAVEPLARVRSLDGACLPTPPLEYLVWHSASFPSSPVVLPPLVAPGGPSLSPYSTTSLLPPSFSSFAHRRPSSHNLDVRCVSPRSMEQSLSPLPSSREHMLPPSRQRLLSSARSFSLPPIAMLDLLPKSSRDGQPTPLPHHALPPTVPHMIVPTVPHTLPPHAPHTAMGQSTSSRAVSRASPRVVALPPSSMSRSAAHDTSPYVLRPCSPCAPPSSPPHEPQPLSPRPFARPAPGHRALSPAMGHRAMSPVGQVLAPMRLML